MSIIKKHYHDEIEKGQREPENRTKVKWEETLDKEQFTKFAEFLGWLKKNQENKLLNNSKS